MGVKIIGNFELLKLMIERDGEKAKGASFMVMDDKADEIVEKAKDNAPRDKFNLERAIRRIPARNKDGSHRQRGVDGRFKSYKITIDVAPEIADKKTGQMVNIEQYAAIMHESPFAGADTEANAEKRAEGKVPGRKYLERAFNDVDPSVVPDMITKVRESI